MRTRQQSQLGDQTKQSKPDKHFTQRSTSQVKSSNTTHNTAFSIMSSASIIIIKKLVAIAALLALVSSIEAKFLRRSRIYEDSLGGYDSPYAGSTGERVIMTVRGARNPYDGSAPSKIAIEDNPYRGAYPRGVYDRLDSGYGRGSRMPMYPSGDYGYNSPYGGYGSGYGGSMMSAPNRIAVTGVFPYGYGSRFA